jgi:competence protein CoiA
LREVIFLLIAMDENGEQLVAGGDLNRDRKYYCPSCRNAVHFKKGSVMRPHFAHYKSEACDFFSEGETAEHIQGKFDLLEWFKKEGFPIEMEAYIPALQQRPDLLVAKRYAVEFQCSQIPIAKVAERTEGYLKAGYEIVWILGEQFEHKKQLTAFQRACLREWEGRICLFHYSVGKQRLVAHSDFSSEIRKVDYRKRHQQLLKARSFGATSFQKLLYENQDTLVSMPNELYHPLAHEWMIQGDPYVWKYQFILWLETMAPRRVITQKMVDIWVRAHLNYYLMPQISMARKKQPVFEFIDVLIQSGVLKELSRGSWSLRRYPKRYKYLEEKF